jgi:type VI secretion system secreted protein Hcp
MAYDAYLYIKGVEGESTAKIDPKPATSDKAPMEIFSFSFGASNPASFGTQGGGAGTGKVSMSSFNIMKRMDKASPILFQACCQGEHYAGASVILRKAGGKDNKQQTFVQYDFEDVYIDSTQISGSGGGDDYPTESVSLSFAKVKVTYSGQQKDGAFGKLSEAAWDVTTATA